MPHAGTPSIFAIWPRRTALARHDLAFEDGRHEAGLVVDQDQLGHGDVEQHEEFFEKTSGHTAARRDAELDRIAWPPLPAGRHARPAGLGVTGCASWRSGRCPDVHADRHQSLHPARRHAAGAAAGRPLAPRRVRARGLRAGRARRDAWPVDVVRADAHFNYYERKTFVARLNQDVIAPGPGARLSRDLDRRHLARRPGRADLREGASLGCRRRWWRWRRIWAKRR